MKRTGRRPESPPSLGRRLYWDLRLFGLPAWVRDLWNVALTVLVVGSLVTQAAQNDRTTQALCSLRQDLEARVAGGERFLREHPHGIPGIPALTLRQSVDGQRRTIRALGGLKCRPSR